MHVFYNVLDLALINSWILYKKMIKFNISRRAFIQQMSEELIGAELARKFVPAIEGPILLPHRSDASVELQYAGTDLHTSALPAENRSAESV